MEPFDLRKCYKLKEALGGIAEPLVIDQVAIDSRRISSKNALFVALTGLHFDGHDFIRQAYRAGARICIVKQDVCLDAMPPGIRFIKVADPLKALQHIAATYRQSMRAKVIAITGSHGKTMLKDALHHLFSFAYNVYASPESFNSQLGVALSLLQIRKEHDFAIIEAGISQLNEMATHMETILPDHAIVTNIGLAHVSSLGNRQAIAQEKMKLLSQLPLNNWCLLPNDEILIPHIPKKAQCYYWDAIHPQLPHIIALSPGERARMGYEVVFPNGTKTQGVVPEGLSYVFDLIRIAVKGAHLVGIAPQKISEALATYTPEPMRIELWKTQTGATVINDTYCADPMSCDTALKQFESLEYIQDQPKGKKIFLFGGLRHLSRHPEIDMQRIAHAVMKHGVNLCILTQHNAVSQLVAAINMISPQTEVIVAKDLREALQEAKSIIRPNDTIVIKCAKKQKVNDIIKAFDESLPNNQVIINLAAIQSNIEGIRTKLHPGTRIMVMVKALAYGTDDVRIAKFLKNSGIDILGVSYVDEGVSMRQAGVTQSIFVLNAAEYEAQKAIKWDLEIGVSEPELIQALQRIAREQNKKVRVHLHVDTGMSRFGCRIEDACRLAQLIHDSSHLVFEGLMTHFATAENPEEDAFTLNQARLLQSVADELKPLMIEPKWVHACNSSAAIRFGFSQFNMVRIGLAAYGLHSSEDTQSQLKLQPAISLISRIVGINHCAKGDSISYGRTHTIDRDRAKIAVLPIGYFDGLHRNYSGRGQVMIRGKLAPMIGRICMDYMMVDISDNSAAEIGDPVLIFGEDEVGHYLSPEELARKGGSIVHELMTCLGPRIRRLFIYDEALRPR